MTTSRQPKGIPVGGQFAATAHSEAGVTLTRQAQTRAELVALLEQGDAHAKAKRQELREAEKGIDQEHGKIGAALAALKLKKVFPAAETVQFDRIPTWGTGVAVNPRLMSADNSLLYPKNPWETLMDAPDHQRKDLEAALSYLSSVADDDLEAQGIRAVIRPQGAVYELNLENALTLAAERASVHPAGPAPANLSTPAVGEERTLGAGEHGLPGVETLTIANLGPGKKFTDRNVISMTYTLPAEANIRDLYDFDDRSRTEAYWAARHAVADLLGCKEFPEFELNGLPGDGISLDGEGNVTFRQHDYFRPGASIDPEDLRSWTDDLRQFSEPAARARLETAITERYNEV